MTKCIHKLFIHSIFVNLATCSCEGGEGIIAVMKHLFRFQNRTIDEAFRRVLVRMIRERPLSKCCCLNNEPFILLNLIIPKCLKLLFFKMNLPSRKILWFWKTFFDAVCSTKASRGRKCNQKKTYGFVGKLDAIVWRIILWIQ